MEKLFSLKYSFFDLVIRDVPIELNQVETIYWNNKLLEDTWGKTKSGSDIQGYSLSKHVRLMNNGIYIIKKSMFETRTGYEFIFHTDDEDDGGEYNFYLSVSNDQTQMSDVFTDDQDGELSRIEQMGVYFELFKDQFFTFKPRIQ